MEKNQFELKPNSSETSSKEQLQEKLKMAKEKRVEILDQAHNFYDRAMMERYVDAVQRFGAGSPTVEIYMQSDGDDYSEVLENYKKYKDFETNHLGPINKEITEIDSEIRQIAYQEIQDNKQQLQIEAENKFKNEKEAFANRFYDALDAIHSQIPQEAHDVGMSTEVALKTYLPELIRKAERIEYYIKKIEDVIKPFELANIKREIDLNDRDLLEK